MLRKTLVPSLILTAFFASITEAKAQFSPIVIDDFSAVAEGVYQYVENDGLPGTILTDIDTGLSTFNVIGGSRRLTLENVTNSEPSSLGSNILVDSNLGGFLWSNDVGTQSKASALWDANGNGLNVTLNGNETLSIGIQTIDRNAVIRWTFVDDGGRTGIATATNLASGETVSLSLNDPDDFIFDDDFNFTEVDQISLMLDSDGINAIDAALQFAVLTPPGITTVPEPGATLGIFALGGVGLLAGRSRKKKD